MDWKLEVVGVPVSDFDRAKTFYAERIGFNVDLDTTISEDLRIVQLTPPGSGCSIHLRVGTPDMAPGSVEGLMLIVSDIDAAHDHLVNAGVEATEVRHFDNGKWVEGRGGDWNSFVDFKDPDGNGWTVQERPKS